MSASSTVSPDNALRVARRSTALLLVLIYLQDIFWLAASRGLHVLYGPIYPVAPFDWLIVLAFVAYAALFAGFAYLVAGMVRPIPKLVVARSILPASLILAIALNVATAIVLPSDSRYVSGGLTGMAGIAYGVKESLKLAVVALLIRERMRGQRIPRVWTLLFLMSCAFAIDGLASALTVGVITVLLVDIRFSRPRTLIIALAAGAVLLWVGFAAKFSAVPDYVTPEFMFRWLIARFAIQAEHMYTFLSGESVIGSTLSYSDLVLRAISNRFDIVMGDSPVLVYPRSVAEATYYDIYGFFGGGSSPGALLSTLLFGPMLFFLVPFFLAFLFIQFFYPFSSVPSFIHLCAYSFLFKTVHSNFSEYLTVISPTLMISAAFACACLVLPRSARDEQHKTRPRAAPAPQNALLPGHQGVE